MVDLFERNISELSSLVYVVQELITVKQYSNYSFLLDKDVPGDRHTSNVPEGCRRPSKTQEIKGWYRVSK